MKQILLKTLAIPAVWVIVSVLFITHLERETSEEMHDEALEALEEREASDAARRQTFAMLRDPESDIIPANARERELAFAHQHSRFKIQGSNQILSTEWRSRGPANLSGRTRAVAVDASNPSIVLAGGATGGMWRSVNGGLSWTRATALTDIASVTCAAQDTRTGRTNTWFYGTGEYLGTGDIAGNGIFTSSNGGISWSVLPSTAGNTNFQYVHALALDGSNTASNAVQTELYAATNSGIQRSADGGATWQTVLSANTAGFTAWSDVAVTRTGVVYASIGALGRQGVFRSADGLTWTDITPAGLALMLPQTFPDANRVRISLAVAATNENACYALMYTASQQTSSPVPSRDILLYKYSSGMWENRSQNLPSDYEAQGGYCMAIAVSPRNENLVILGGVGCYRSTDGFASRTNTTLLSASNDGVDHHTFVFSPANVNLLYAGFDQGVKNLDLSTQPAIWAFLNKSCLTTQFYAVALDPQATDNTTIMGGMQDNSTYFTENTAADARWSNINGGDGGFCALTNNARTVYSSAQNGLLWRDTLDGSGRGIVQIGVNNYTEVGVRIDPAGKSEPLFVNPFALDPSNNAVLYYPCGRDIWRHENLYAVSLRNKLPTYNRSDGWTQLRSVAPVNAQFSAIGTARLSNGSTRLYIGTNTGKIYKLDNAQSSLSATSVADISVAKGFPANAYVSCIAADPTNADRAIAVFSNYNVQSLFLTENAGATWLPMSGNLEERPDGRGGGPSCRWLTMLNVRGTLVYFVGTSTGLYATSRLQGMSTVWVPEGASTIGNVIVPMVVARQSDGLVLVGTHGNGIFTANVTDMPTSVQNNASTTDEIRLFENAPNPFSPQTTIRYELPQRSHVRLRVMDMSGREIITLVNQPQSAGAHETIWDGRGYGGGWAASGLYIYHLISIAENGTTTSRTGQMQLVR